MIRAGKHERANRLSWEIAGNPACEFVCHTCDNPICVNPSHLFAGDSQSNVDDMHAKERAIRKLRASDAFDMRNAFALGEPSASIARRYGVTNEMANQVLRGKAWSRAPGPVVASTRATCTTEQR